MEVGSARRRTTLQQHQSASDKRIVYIYDSYSLSAKLIYLGYKLHIWQHLTLLHSTVLRGCHIVAQDGRSSL